MPVDSISSTNSTAQSVQSALGQNQALGQDQFLKLLVTQMTNQDPLKPMDQDQMLAQLAQFSTVEGIHNINTSQTRMQASQLLGKEVEAMTYKDNAPVSLKGPVQGVRWDKDGIFLTIKGSDKEIKMDDVTAIRDAK